MGILILSSHDKPVLTARVNHAAYAAAHGYDYLFDATPYRVASPYDQKLCAILATLRRSTAEWVFWIDEDVYFMNHAIRLESFLPSQQADFVICNSPVNPSGGWTKINSGAFFVRNTKLAQDILAQAMATPNAVVKTWWNRRAHGIFNENGDQERLLYCFETNHLLDEKVQIRPFQAFNARPYHFTERADQHFICHFAGVGNKAASVKALREKFALDVNLLKQ